MKSKNKNAISLIVLVITIIILSILAATVVISLSNTNIINGANDAVKKTEAQQIEELKALMYAEGVLGNIPEPQTVGNTTFTWSTAKQKVLATTDNVVIPDGFYYVEGSKSTGLVIEDIEGNQFVWIPVEYTLSEGETADANGLYPSFKEVFKRGAPEETAEGSGIYKMTGEFEEEVILGHKVYLEPDDAKYLEQARTYDEEVEEYYAMCRSVQEYNGFYIARFKAGDGDVTEPRTWVTEAHKVVSKKDAIIYNYVTFGIEDDPREIGDFQYQDCADDECLDLANFYTYDVAPIVYLAQNMYKSHKSVVSTLTYGVQWDAIMNFVFDVSHTPNNYSSWGEMVKNIYGLADQNYSENTMEKYRSGFPFVHRVGR